MKKITLFFAFLLTGLVGNAQLANGSTAPNFTGVDINGNSHTLSTYLAAGKSVIMDISATWCSPCWNYHNAHHLEDFYYAYGPQGSNEAVVLFIEGDGQTTNADLHGTGTDTQGDWVAGTPYPMIDSAAIADLYAITYFPTVYRICPSGIVNEIGSATAASIKSGVSSNCGTALIGVQNYARAYDSKINLCSSTGSPTVKLKNYGANAITAAIVNLKENGTVIASKTTTGSFAQFGTKTVTFDPVVFNPSSTYTYEVTSVNGATSYNAALANSALEVVFAQETPTLDVVVKVYTDNWPTEISWRIKNSAGTIVANGGPYVGDADNGGGQDANTTMIQNVTLPNPSECYTVDLLDSWGDGWGGGTTPHGLEIFSNGTSIVNFAVGNFGTTLSNPSALKTAALSTNVSEKESFKVFPNPSKGIFNFNSEKDFNIEVVDVLGKVVYTKSNLSNNSSIDLSNLSKGVYIAKIKTESTSFTQKIILE